MSPVSPEKTERIVAVQPGEEKVSGELWVSYAWKCSRPGWTRL